MKKIMILGGSILQLPAIEMAREMGLSVIVADMDPAAVGFSVPGVIKEVISTVDTPGILAAAKRHRIDGIMTLASDRPMRTVAVVCAALGLTGVSEDTALKATNKAVMREALKESGVPSPRFFRVKGMAAFREAVETLRAAGFRCIVKPADNSGSRGIRLLSPTDALDEVYAYTAAFSCCGELVVEEFVEGPEVSVETFALDGDIRVVQITDKLTTGAPYFVELGHSQPSLLDAETKDKIAALAVAANRAIGIRNGPSHTEIKVTRDGPKLIELGARLGGDSIATHLVPYSTGVDLVRCCILNALGEKAAPGSASQMGAAIRYLKTGVGTIEAVTGLEEARALRGVRQVSFTRELGERVGEIRSSNDRIGYVIAQAETAAEAIRIAEEGVGRIRVSLRAADCG